MRISDWSSDVCSSDLRCSTRRRPVAAIRAGTLISLVRTLAHLARARPGAPSASTARAMLKAIAAQATQAALAAYEPEGRCANGPSLNSARSEEHTSELQSLMRISYAVFCLKKKNYQTPS